MSARRIAAAVAGAAVFLASAPAAHAVWAGAGAGSATAAAASDPRPVAISAGTAAAQPAFPTGSPTGGVSLTLQNPNPYRVHVAGVVLDAAGGSGGFSANAAGCGLAFTPPAGAGWDVPAGGTVDLELPNTVTMAASAPASCAGLAVDIHLKAAS
jgi:hypothetical protein